MILQEINGQRILTPFVDMYLYNAEARVISEKVYLGKEADINTWVEIAAEEKEALEREWEELEGSE